MRVTMDSEGRLSIPTEIREQLGWFSDAVLEVRVRNGLVELEAVTVASATAEHARDESNGAPRVAAKNEAARNDAAKTEEPSGRSTRDGDTAETPVGQAVTRAFAVVKRSGNGGGATALATATATAAALARADRPQLDMLIRMAIAHRRQVELVYAGRPRLVEPHDYGLRGGEPQLLVYQRSGESRSGNPSGWRSLRIEEITDFRVLDATFPGRRPADKHVAWDVLFVRVDEP